MWLTNLLYLPVVVVATLVAWMPASADTSMWVVEKDGERLYLGGTIHVLSNDDYPLPIEFDDAYADAARVVLETDPGALGDPAAQQQLMSKMTYQDGTTLPDHLSRSTWRRLQRYSAERRIPLESLQILKPGMLVITLTVVELQRLGLTGIGVDQYFADAASADGKPLGKLESVEQQIDFLSRLGEEDPDATIRYTLRDMARLPSLFRSIKRHWRSGNLEGLNQDALAPLRLEFPAVYDMLLVRRNRDWLPRIEKMLESAEVELVLVGALHLVGDDGLLALLRSKDYSVTRF